MSLKSGRLICGPVVEVLMEITSMLDAGYEAYHSENCVHCGQAIGKQRLDYAAALITEEDGPKNDGRVVVAMGLHAKCTAGRDDDTVMAMVHAGLQRLMPSFTSSKAEAIPAGVRPN